MAGLSFSAQNDQDPFEAYTAGRLGPFGPLKDMFRSLDAAARDECAPTLANFIEMVLPHVSGDGDDDTFEGGEDMNDAADGDGMCACARA
jgi:hypothetical protein